ncbi:MAG: hypothetical protein SPL78_07965 [Bacteroidales bacterium]|nr:hypothetical protein [Bacteroidales bacterium]
MSNNNNLSSLISEDLHGQLLIETGEQNESNIDYAVLLTVV